MAVFSNSPGKVCVHIKALSALISERDLEVGGVNLAFAVFIVEASCATCSQSYGLSELLCRGDGCGGRVILLQ